MDPDSCPSESRFPEHDHHGDTHEEVRDLYQIAVQERDDLREYVNKLERQILPRFVVDGTNLAEIFVSQKDAYLERVINLEKAMAEAEKAHSYDSQKLQQSNLESKRAYEDIKSQIDGRNGYKDRLQSAHIALELANNNRPADVLEYVGKLADMTKERDELIAEAHKLKLRIEELHLNWNAALTDVEKLRKEKVEREKFHENPIALREANQEIERLRRANELQDSYHVEAANSEVRRLQGEKIEWEQERTNFEGRAAELSLRIRTLEDMLSASEAQETSADAKMSDVDADEGKPTPRQEALGDAVWRRWSNRLWDHIQVQPKEVNDIYNLASANLYRPGGALPDPDPGPQSSRHQFPGVTWVKQLVALGSNRPVAPLVEEGTWKQWANALQDFILRGPNEVEALYRLGNRRQLSAGVEWIQKLITIASDRPTVPDRPVTLKEYQLSVELKEAQIKIEELQMCGTDRQKFDGGWGGWNSHEQLLQQAFIDANMRNVELENEADSLTAHYEDEIEQLERKLNDSNNQQNLYKRLYESGQVHSDKLDEIEKLEKDLGAAYERGQNFKRLLDKEKVLSAEHEEVWQQKYNKEVAGADKHAAGLVEEIETLQGRLNGAHGVIAGLEKEAEKLRKQIAGSNTGAGGLRESIFGVASEEGRQSAPGSQGSESESESENENESKDLDEEEKADAEKLKIVESDLYNTLEEVEELKLKLGFTNRAFDDMKEEFEIKISQVEDIAKEAMTDRERMAEKLRQAQELFRRGVAAEVRKLEREGRLKLRNSWTQTNRLSGDDHVFPGQWKGEGRKILATPRAKKPVIRVHDHEESPPLSPLESPLESPDMLMKDDEEYRGPRSGRKGRNTDPQDDVSEAGSEGSIGLRRSPRSTRNMSPIYREVPLNVLLGGRRSGSRKKRKAEDGVEDLARGAETDQSLHGDDMGERGGVKRRGFKMV
ncbi:hypothetical protein MFRU_056g00300 [Monilinia fructicola]|nr:hypothetical protein MFRU_056g00300 [Monilinia fructicola]